MKAADRGYAFVAHPVRRRGRGGWFCREFRRTRRSQPSGLPGASRAQPHTRSSGQRLEGARSRTKGRTPRMASTRVPPAWSCVVVFHVVFIAGEFNSREAGVELLDVFKELGRQLRN